MRSTVQRSALFLLAVFVAGGIFSPLAHRFSHVHSLEHRHGDAAAHFSFATSSPGGLFFVEEQTLPHDLTCELCARLTLDDLEAEAASLSLHCFATTVPPGDDALAGRMFLSSRIRAPPAVS